MKYEVKDLNVPSRWNMRIWDDDNGEWLCQSNKDALTYYGFDITGGETTEFQGLPKWHPDRRLIWEQSTGLKDKNGKEIYEGDIVDYNDDGECIGVVEYDAPEFCLNADATNWARMFLKGAPHQRVIGNIHENPELIKEKE